MYTFLTYFTKCFDVLFDDDIPFWNIYKTVDKKIVHPPIKVCRMDVIKQYGNLKPRSHCPGFSPAVATVGTPGQHRSDTCKHRIVKGYTVLNWRSPGSGPGGFNFFKTTGTHRAAKQRRLVLGHHCSSSGINLISTVRPPGETVANRHELWWYGDSRLGHGVSRRRAGRLNYGLVR